MSDKRCPFCCIEAEEVIAESQNFLALYNIAPILPGHCLVVPKKHAVSLLDLSESEAAEFMVFGRKVAKLLLKAFKARSFNWTIQEREEAGQTVEHVHMHLIPRIPADLPKPGDWYPLLRQAQAELIDSNCRPKLSAEERKKIVAFIKAAA